MKIEIITDTYRPDINGVAMTLGRLTDGLRIRGHRVHVVHTAAETADGESSARSVALPGYPDVRVGLPKPFNFRQRLRRLSRPKLACRSVILSDIHLGSPDSKADEVVHFLKHIKCEKLILNGDIIDGWSLKRGGKWTSRHSRLIRKFIKLSERDRSEIFYIRGNHDEILDRFLPISLGRIQLVKQHIHEAINGKRYLVVHGDGFDSVSTNHRWLAALGAVGYDTLLMINRHYNKWRRWHGKEYYSISKLVKAKVKSAVSFLDRYEQLLQNLARQNHCDGIICGHIHTPDDKQVGDVHYLNSGDWVESLTAIIEHHDGRMELVEYTDFMRRLYLVEDTPATQHEEKDQEDDILVA